MIKQSEINKAIDQACKEFAKELGYEYDFKDMAKNESNLEKYGYTLGYIYDSINEL